MNTVNPSDFNFIRELVHRHSAIALETDKAYLIELRLSPLARQAGFSTLPEFIAALRLESANSPLYRQVIEAMTTHETSFFRDLHPFESLQSTLLPNMLDKRGTATITIWCAACSSGQEPYSIAMLIREAFPAQVARRVRIIATDLSEAIIERARSGVYNQIEISRGLPPALLSKYFDKQDASWRIRPEIRHMVEFQTSNLATPWPMFPMLDLVFMRNVLIYFDVETKKALLAKVRQVLKPDGYLFLGSSETTLNLDAAFEPVTMGKSLCYQLRPT